MSKEPLAKDQDKFVLRLPEGMRDRIKKSADANNRSMNAEIVQALEEMFPKEPDVTEVLDRLHKAIEQAESAPALPYRSALIDALDKFSERLASGLEFDQYQSRTQPPEAVGLDRLLDRLDRWRRASKTGVETSDLQRELERGLLDKIGRNSIASALAVFKRERPNHALKILRLGDVKFAEPESAHRAIVDHLRQLYSEKWGDPDEPYEPWAEE